MATMIDRRSAAGEALHIPAVSLGAHRLFAAELPGGFALYVSEREVLLLPLSATERHR